MALIIAHAHNAHSIVALVNCYFKFKCPRCKVENSMNTEGVSDQNEQRQLANS